MKSFILSFSIFGLLGAAAFSGQIAKPTTELPVDENTVYICNSPNAYAYHSYRSCGGLSRCSYSISQVSHATAQSKGRRACKKCYQ